MNPLERHEIPGSVTAVSGKGGLPALHIETPGGSAVIYQHGAHIANYRKAGGPPVLFLSESSEFQPDKPIRGGVPVIFPSFGAKEGQPFHGTARITDWDLTESLRLPDGSVRLRFTMPGLNECSAALIVTVGDSLQIELAVTNTGSADFTFENCLHTYFHVGDIHRTEVRGLKGAAYHDQLLGQQLTETGDAIGFTAETDRIYQNTDATAEIVDPALGRILRIRKSGSLSTVVWNPWIEKSKRMPDFGDDEYLQMVCVESGNVREHAITLAPGQSASLVVGIESLPL
jgi:glucose-6-phosphate 1-epimerase